MGSYREHEREIFEEQKQREAERFKKAVLSIQLDLDTKGLATVLAKLAEDPKWFYFQHSRSDEI